MKSIYLIYISIDESTFNIFKYVLPNVHDYKWIDDKFYGLYAWTNGKSKLTDFMEVRDNKVFNVSKKELDEDEYDLFKDHFHLLELKRYNYKTNDKKDMEVVSTKNEMIEIFSNGKENYMEFGPTVDDSFNYRIFKKDLINALDILGYTSIYDLNYGSMEENDLASYNGSYGLGPVGNMILAQPSELNLLIYLFYYTFYGKKRGK